MTQNRRNSVRALLSSVNDLVSAVFLDAIYYMYCGSFYHQVLVSNISVVVAMLLKNTLPHSEMVYVCLLLRTASYQTSVNPHTTRACQIYQTTRNNVWCCIQYVFSRPGWRNTSLLSNMPELRPQSWLYTYDPQTRVLAQEYRYRKC